jgi:hypothetical protein
MRARSRSRHWASARPSSICHTSGPKRCTSQAAEAFLESWDFQAYIAEFRSGKTHSRREEISHELQQAKETVT